MTTTIGETIEISKEAIDRAVEMLKKIDPVFIVEAQVNMETWDDVSREIIKEEGYTSGFIGNGWKVVINEDLETGKIKLINNKGEEVEHTLFVNN